jgi:hypothetical protein
MESREDARAHESARAWPRAGLDSITAGMRARLNRRRSPARLVLDAATLIGVVFAAYYWLHLTATLGSPVDAAWYWQADPNAYPHPELAGSHGYNYVPPFEQLMIPLRLLPFDIFVAAWRAAILVVLVWLAGPFTLPVLLTVPVASEVNAGNIQILLAGAIVAGFRWSGFWTLVVLSKLTPGVGLLWFAIRREWRPLALALGLSASIAAISYVLDPAAWGYWLSFILGHGSPAGPPYPWTIWERLPVAVAIVALGAWRGWRWTVVVASTIALPVFYIISPSMFVGVLPFVRERLERFLGLRGTVDWPGAIDSGLRRARPDVVDGPVSPLAHGPLEAGDPLT